MRHALVSQTIVLALLLLQSSVGCPGAEPVAFVRAVEGDVSIEHDGEKKAAILDQGLVIADIVSTGDGASTVLQFSAGSVLSLEQNASLLIERDGGVEASIGVLVLEGTVQAEGSGAGLSLRTPFGRARLGDGKVGIEVSPGKGLRVIIGQIVLESEDGTKVTISEGNRWLVGGIILDDTASKKSEEDVENSDIVLSPIKVVLLARSKQVQVRKEGEKEWRKAKKRDALVQGDAVRTRRGGGTLVQFGDGGDILLHKGSQITLGASNTGNGVSRARYSLESGSATIHLASAEGDVGHELVAGNTTLKVFPGLQRATVDVSAQRNGDATIDVRLGRVQLQDGTSIEAGHSAALKAGKVAGEVRAVAKAAVRLRPGRTTELYYKNGIPPVAFTWEGEPVKATGAFDLEVAIDKDFTKFYLRERLTDKRFVFNHWSSGKYFWRIHTADGWKSGRLRILKHRENNCENCGRVNDVFSNGEKTTIYYQTTLPAVALRWKPVADAARYRIKVFADGAFDKPVMDKTVAQDVPRLLKLKSGSLKEGRYYWLVTAVDAKGDDVYTGKMNSLQIAYDNAVRDLRIHSPRNGAKVRGATLQTRGEVQLGARLMIAERNVRLDRKSRFSHTVNLSRGKNRLVYKTVSKDGVERYYVREVYRR